MRSLNAVTSAGDRERVTQLSKAPGYYRVNAGILAFSRIFSCASVETQASSEFCCNFTISGCVVKLPTGRATSACGRS
jgi:hypothetical protein